MKVYRDVPQEDGTIIKTPIIDLMEVDYTGEDMGNRNVTAVVKWPSPLDLRIGDYIEIEIATLIKTIDQEGGGVGVGRFYMYTLPTIKKTARPLSAGDAFEHTIKFYPPQYELGCVQMRDFATAQASANNIIYTGFDVVTFFGGAHALLDRIIACMDEGFKNGSCGKWTYQIAPSVDEYVNTALESFTFSFSGNSVADALQYLNKEDYCNTTYFINDRTIYVGFKRPYLCKVDGNGAIDTKALRLMYGKTSHQPIDLDHGGIFDITKSVSDDAPITRLYAYGGSRNLNRYYCSDRLASSRYVNKLMLPSFDNDGRTDYIDSEEGIARYGVREGTKQFEDIYPSLRFMTYGDLRKVKYVIKIKASGLRSDEKDESGFINKDLGNTLYGYAVSRAQCYKVVDSTSPEAIAAGINNGTKGINCLVESYPEDDLVICCHTAGKVVKTILCGAKIDNETILTEEQRIAHARARQIAKDGKIPTTDGTNPIDGACFLVHDNHMKDITGKTFSDVRRLGEWIKRPTDKFDDIEGLYPSDDRFREAQLHRIEYVDTAWLTDVYVAGVDSLGNYLYDDQTEFVRGGYSAYCYARINDTDNYPDSTLVNEVIAVEPVVLTDTDENVENKSYQKTFDIYMRDCGFQIDEQNDFGEMMHIVGSTMKINVLDGLLAGREFEVNGTMVDSQSSVIPAYNENGVINDGRPGSSAINFFEDTYVTGLATLAFDNGAIWRIRVNRDASQFSDLGIVLPSKDICMKKGDHVVFLDIYMPDIYVRASEERLYREAVKYLDKVDDGKVEYSVSTDKVRFMQIPMYALQVREGVNVRLEDTDLQTDTEVNARTIFSSESGAHQMSKFTKNEFSTSTRKTGVRNKMSTEDPEQLPTGQYRFYVDAYDHYHDVLIAVASPSPATSGSTIQRVYDGISMQMDSFAISAVKATGELHLKIDVNADGTDKETTKDIVLELSDITIYGKKDQEVKDVYVTLKDREIVFDKGDNNTPYYYFYYNVSGIERTVEPSDGDKVWCRHNANIDFIADRCYEVTVGIPHYGLISNRGKYHASRWPNIVLISYEGGMLECDAEVERLCTYYGPSLIGDYNTLYTKLKYRFSVPPTFNDTFGSKIAFDFYYTAEGETDPTPNYAIDIFEVIRKNVDSSEKVIKHIDLVVKSVNVKIYDNSRSEYEEGEPYPLYQPGPVVPIRPMQTREVQATLQNKTQASNWATLMSSVDETRIESDINTQQLTNIINVARQSYSKILSLKDSIFDPDGTCDKTFLQVMMLQVGADSMNYRLKLTSQAANGKCSNFEVTEKTEDTNSFFKVDKDDVLYHYVYSQGSQAGVWGIPGNKTFELKQVRDEYGAMVWPVYYVALKCSIDGNSGVWVCEPIQHAVNELDNYYYFNWGILTPDVNGNYAIMETRGNAYMYGDNIVCGKISSLAKNCWFDLTNGNFVLGNGTGEADLSYINGVLTIKGVNDGAIDSMLSRLGAIENEEICGENVSFVSDVQFEAGHIGDSVTLIQDGFSLVPNRKYVYSAIHSGYSYSLYIMDDNGSTLLKTFNYQGGEHNDELKFKTTGFVGTIILRLVASNDACTLHNIMIQEGTKRTEFHPYVDHLVNAMHGSTEIAGGLMLTNLIMLKDENGNVQSGMSGLDDNIAMWAGGGYQDALSGTTPVVITKKGAESRIGCFEIIDEKSVRVVSADGKSEVIVSAGSNDKDTNIIVRYDGKPRVIITGDEVKQELSEAVSLYGKYVSGTNYNGSISVQNQIIDIVSFHTASTFFTCSGTMQNIRVLASVSAFAPFDRARMMLGIMCADKQICYLQYDFGEVEYQSSAKTYVETRSVKVPSSLTSTTDSKLRIVVRSLSVRMRGENEWTTDVARFANYMRIPYLWICKKKDGHTGGAESDFEDASITLNSTGSEDLIQIGRNGIQVSKSHGGYMQILNDEQDLHVRMAGLPVIEPTEENRLWIDNGVLKVHRT